MWLHIASSYGISTDTEHFHHHLVILGSASVDQAGNCFLRAKW